MQGYIQILKEFETLHTGDIDIDSEEWYNKRESFLDRSKWFSAYLMLADAAKAKARDPSWEPLSPELDKTKEVYVSSEEFPTLGYVDSSDEAIVGKINTSFYYTDHYGSSSICIRDKLLPLNGVVLDKKTLDDGDNDDIKGFVDFFSELGKEICLVYDHTYDTTVLYRNHYDYNEETPTIKLCVSVGKILA